jgi:hypothetical protein
LGEAYFYQGNFAEVEVRLRSNPSEEETIEMLGCAHARSGNRAAAIARAAELEPLVRASGRTDRLAAIYANLGGRTGVFDEFRIACERKSPALLWLKLAPTWDPIRDDPRFTELVKKVGLGQE